MRHGWLVLAMLSGCTSEEPAKPIGVDHWEISASAPVAAGTSLSASLTAKGDGIRAFGACLLVDLHNGKACDAVADCATGQVVTPAADHFDYCLAPPGQSTKTCWTRNGGDLAWCNKAPPPGRAAGTYLTPPVDASALTGTTRWMTVACLNAGTWPLFSDGPLPPCVSADPAAAGYSAHATSAISQYTSP